MFGAGVFGLAATPVAAGFDGEAAASVERVIDGDTVKMRVAIWIDQEIVVSVRLADVDAPELFRPKCAAERTLAEQSKAFTEDFLSRGDIRLANVRYGKYAGRVVAQIAADGEDLGEALVSAGLASRGKTDWCPMS